MHDADEQPPQTDAHSPLQWEQESRLRRVADHLIADLRGPRSITLGFFVAVITTLVVVAVYANHPQPATAGATDSYLQVAHRILTSGQVVDPTAMPGYPLLIALVFAVAGQGNLVALGVVQAILFVASAVEVYVLVYLLLRRAWAACVVGLLAGGNVILLGYAKFILPEALSVWLTITLALAVTLFLHHMTARNLWLVAGCTLALMLTRDEWIVAPVLLFAYLLFAAWRRGAWRHVLPDLLAALVVLYAVITIFVAVNTSHNGYAGTSCLENVNLLGKVMQYGMQSEAPVQYSDAAVIVNSYVAQGDLSPWDVIRDHPEFANHCYALAGTYARSIIQDHLLEFAGNSVVVAVSSLTAANNAIPQFVLSGPFAGILAFLAAFAAVLYGLGWLLIPCAVFWAVLVGLRRSGRVETVQAMGAVILLALYWAGTLGALAYSDYARLNAPVEMVLLIIIGSTILVASFMVVPVAWRLARRRQAWQGETWASAWRGIERITGRPATSQTAPIARRAPALRPRPVAPPPRGVRGWWQRADALARSPYVLPGVVLVIITSAVVAAFYLNHPAPDTFNDTPAYTIVTQRILDHFQFSDIFRMPIYPALIALVYLVAGNGNFVAVENVQAVLFVLATVEVYAIACLVLRRRWIAFAIGLLVGANLTLITFIKPILSEGITFWLTATLALFLVLFVRSGRARDLWLVGVFSTALLLTRAEWEYIILPLLAYLLLIAAHRGLFLRLLPHAVMILVLFYGVMWAYSTANQAQFGYFGLAVTPRVNLLGKVMQYDMQNEAPPQYAWVAAIVNSYVQRGVSDPFVVLNNEPSLAANYQQTVGEYATAVIVHHPLQYLADSIPLAYSSLGTQYYSMSLLDSSGPYFGPLQSLLATDASLYGLYGWFPLCALVWLLLLMWPRTARLRTVEMMGGIILLALYGVTVTTLGTFREYVRLHVPYDSLMMVVIAGTVVIAVELVGDWMFRQTEIRSFLQTAGEGMVAAVREVGISSRWIPVGTPLTKPLPSRPATWAELAWNLPDRPEDATEPFMENAGPDANARQ